MAGHDEWETPQELYNLLNAEFHFDLDAACSLKNCKVALSPGSKFVFGITESMNALVYPWKGQSVWCNPPYSMLPSFVERAWEQCQVQKNTVVMLIPAYTDPKYWWETIIPHADEVRFLKGRVSFLEGGKKKMSARFPSVVVVFRYRAGEQQKQAHCWWWDWKSAVIK